MCCGWRPEKRRGQDAARERPEQERAEREQRREHVSPPAPAMPKPRKITLPVMFAMNTRPEGEERDRVDQPGRERQHEQGPRERVVEARRPLPQWRPVGHMEDSATPLRSRA